MVPASNHGDTDMRRSADKGDNAHENYDFPIIAKLLFLFCLDLYLA